MRDYFIVVLNTGEDQPSCQFFKSDKEDVRDIMIDYEKFMGYDMEDVDRDSIENTYFNGEEIIVALVDLNSKKILVEMNELKEGKFLVEEGEYKIPSPFNTFYQRMSNEDINFVYDKSLEELAKDSKYPLVGILEPKPQYFDSLFNYEEKPILEPRMYLDPKGNVFLGYVDKNKIYELDINDVYKAIDQDEE